jgi:hypothetical protein
MQCRWTINRHGECVIDKIFVVILMAVTIRGLLDLLVYCVGKFTQILAIPSERMRSSAFESWEER